MDIKTQREKAGITQAELATRLKVTQAAIAIWETGEAMPRADKLPELAKVLGCSIDALFER